MTKNIKVLLLYPPEQSWPGMMVKPNGSLAYPYLGGALRDVGVEVDVYDACVGNSKDNLEDFFKKSTKLDSGMIRTGVSDSRILEVVNEYDAVGITSIFSQQETRVLHCARIIKKHYPNKLLFTGGVNAKSRSSNFFKAGFDIICTSESESTIQQIAKILQKGSRDFTSVGKIYFKNKNGKIISNSNFGEIVWDLDKLPIPAWDLLPNERYWKIGRPHGGGQAISGKKLKYVSMMTSRGCPFKCSFCHIADETEDSISGAIGRFRIKSDERVKKELYILKDKIGANQVFIEDDSLFGMKRRAIRLLKKIVGLGLDLLDVNGVNTIQKFFDENEAEEIIGKINERGGMLKAIESGWVQQQIADASYEYQRKIEKDDLIVVGINKFTESSENDEEGFTKIEDEIGKRQCDEVSKIKKTNRNLKEIMVKFEKAAKEGGENLIPHMMKAFDNDATLGEVCDLLRSVWGEYRPKEII